MNTNIAYLVLMVVFRLILVYLGGLIQKSLGGSYVIGVQFQKKIGFPIIFGQRQTGKLKFQNDPKRVCPNETVTWMR